MKAKYDREGINFVQHESQIGRKPNGGSLVDRVPEYMRIHPHQKQEKDVNMGGSGT